MFIQMQWIRNAIEVKREQYMRDVANTLEDVRKRTYAGFVARRDADYVTTPAEQEYYLQAFYTVQTFSADEIEGFIAQELKDNNIKQSFEFAITDYFDNTVMSSKGWRAEYYRTANWVLLTPNNSLRREILHLQIKEPQNYIIGKMGWMIVASILFTCIIISAFALTIRTMFNQKKLSEIKSDFINNMTHEFKTPLATISLATDALNNEKVIHDEDKIRYYSGIIKAENKRMNKQVEKILQAARIERQDIKLNLVQMDAHEVIRKVADNFALQIQENNGTLNLDLHAEKHVIHADEVHFSNMIFNLFDNAIKYTKEHPQILVETQMSGSMLAIKIKDNGIGMNKETQARIFEKFYRAHTGNLHNVKGFGLGLSYVKAMVEAHNGRIRVDSAPGKGSTFTISLPVS
jgi:two-component system phosphate regulon sensor histidine kinase PhoR